MTPEPRMSARLLLLAVLALSPVLTGPAFARPQGGASSTAPGAVANGLVTAWDPAAQRVTVEANKQVLTLDTSSALVAGTLAVGARVDVTYAGSEARAISVR